MQDAYREFVQNDVEFHVGLDTNNRRLLFINFFKVIYYYIIIHRWEEKAELRSILNISHADAAFLVPLNSNF